LGITDDDESRYRMSEARARRGCAAHGAKLYRVQCISFSATLTVSRDVTWVTRYNEAKRIASRPVGLSFFTIDRVTLTARLSPKKLALALLNHDDTAFARVERLSIPCVPTYS
jgi:hypothetical protein